MTAATGGGLVADELARQGVTTLFTLCGGHISPILVAAKARGIQVVDVRDEATAAFAADAVSRLGGAPGVAAVTAGPGVTNTVTALENARLAQSPLVLLGGATATILKGRGALQDIDQMALVRPHVKWAAAARRVADLAPAVAHAFDEARAGVPGPTFVECPVDVLYPEAFVREWYLAGGVRQPRTLADRAMRWYLERHLRRLFAAGSPPSRRRSRPEPRAAHAALSHLADRAATALRRAARPVLLVGSQALASGAQPAALADAICRLGIPVYLSGMARGLLGRVAEGQFRHQRKAALREADCVVLAGAPCDFRLDYGRHINRRAVVIGANRSAAELSKNRRPAIGAVAAPDAFLVALAERLAGGHPDWSAWVRALAGREAARDAEIERLAAEPAPPVNPLALCQAIERALPVDAVLVADGGDFVATASYVVRPRGPLSWLDPGVFGTLGVGAGFILGAHACRPGTEIWALFGDGALGFSLAEFHTFARRRVPLVAIVGNDGKWAQIARDQVEVLASEVGTSLGRAEYHRAVEGLGARGLLLDDPARIDETLAAARAAARAGTPVLVNALIGDTAFRKGSISL